MPKNIFNIYNKKILSTVITLSILELFPPLSNTIYQQKLTNEHMWTHTIKKMEYLNMNE